MILAMNHHYHHTPSLDVIHSLHQVAPQLTYIGSIAMWLSLRKQQFSSYNTTFEIGILFVNFKIIARNINIYFAGNSSMNK